MLTVFHVHKGEDGFPGFKGDMGIKGDRVRLPLDLMGFFHHRLTETEQTKPD